MGETAVLNRSAYDSDRDDYAPATFEETDVETSPEIEAAKAEIERTRAEMSGTIDAIKAQLAPERLVAEAKEAVAEAAHEKVVEVKNAVLDKVSDVAHGAGSIASNVVATVSDAAASLGEKASALTDAAKEKWNDLTTNTGDSANGALVAAGAGAVAVAGVAGTKFKESGDLLMDTIRENPIPAALVGVGLGWLLIDAVIKQQKRTGYSSTYVNGSNGYRGEAYDSATYPTGSGAAYGTYNSSNNYATSNGSTSNGISGIVNKASDTLHSAQDSLGDAIDGAKSKVADTAQNLQDKASDLIDSAQSKASDLGNAVQSKASDLGNAVQSKASDLSQAAQTTARQAVDTTQDFITGNPLAAGAIALLAGAVIGLAFPSTDTENEFFGPHRDRLADQAGVAAQDILNKVQNVAGEAMNTAKSSLSDVKDKVQSTVQTQAQQQGLIPA